MYKASESPEQPTLGKAIRKRVEACTQPFLLKAVCWIAIVLGGFGAYLSVRQVAQLVRHEASQSSGFAMVPWKFVGEDSDENLRLGKLTDSARQKFTPYLVGSLSLRAVASLICLFGCIGVLRRHRLGRSVLLAGCTLAILVELVTTALNTSIQLTLLQPFQDYYFDLAVKGIPEHNRIVVAQDLAVRKRPADPASFAARRIVLPVVLSLALVATKVSFYLFLAVYFTRPHVVVHCAPKPPLPRLQLL